MCNNSKFLNETEKENIISYILRGKIKIFIILRPLGCDKFPRPQNFKYQLRSRKTRLPGVDSRRRTLIVSARI